MRLDGRYTETKNNKKLKWLYNKALKIQSAIPHPKIMGVIRECGGKASIIYIDIDIYIDILYDIVAVVVVVVEVVAAVVVVVGTKDFGTHPGMRRQGEHHIYR